MRIKKKHVLLESLLIDVTNEFTPVEKKIFKMLNKHYGDPMKDEEGKKNFNQWEVAAWLIETLNLPYEDAYGLSKTYFWNYNRLFGEIRALRKNSPIPYLFFEHFSNLMENVVKKYDSVAYDNVRIKIDRDSGFDDDREVRLWTGYRGFTLYIPFRNGDIGNRYIYTSEGRKRMIMVRILFFAIDKEGIKVDKYISEESWENDVNQNNFMVQVFTEFGEDESKVDEELMVFEAPYPKPLTYDNFEKVILGIADDVIEKISKTTFKLPSNVESINVDSQLD